MYRFCVFIARPWSSESFYLDRWSSTSELQNRNECVFVFINLAISRERSCRKCRVNLLFPFTHYYLYFICIIRSFKKYRISIVDQFLIGVYLDNVQYSKIANIHAQVGPFLVCAWIRLSLFLICLAACFRFQSVWLFDLLNFGWLIV